MREMDAFPEENPMEPSSGSAEVHAHLSAEPDKGDGMSGKFDPPGGAAEYARRVRDRAEDMMGSARARTSEFRDRVGGAAGRARRGAEYFVDEAEDVLETRTGVLRAARGNPMTALGIAFAVGFLLAGDGEEPERPTSLSKAKNQVKGAIMGGISAAISQQLRTFIEDQGGIGAILSSLGVPLPGGQGREPEFVPDDELTDI